MSLFIQWESQWNDISNRTPSIGFLNLGGWFCSAVCEHLGCVHQLRTTRWPVQIQPQSLLVDFGILVTRKEFWKKKKTKKQKTAFSENVFFFFFFLKKKKKKLFRNRRFFCFVRTLSWWPESQSPLKVTAAGFELATAWFWVDALAQYLYWYSESPSLSKCII